MPPFTNTTFCGIFLYHHLLNPFTELGMLIKKWIRSFLKGTPESPDTAVVNKKVVKVSVEQFHEAVLRELPNEIVSFVGAYQMDSRYRSWQFDVNHDTTLATEEVEVFGAAESRLIKMGMPYRQTGIRQSSTVSPRYLIFTRTL
ncbi:MAG: hypothetical protein JWO40_873 [Candidatus Doudnabacteria bacterium]|nr:hypothetical protein [Candidatus Doudnabacteria bacterium]